MVRSLIQTAAVAATVVWYARSSAAAPARRTYGAVDVTATGTSAFATAGTTVGNDESFPAVEVSATMSGDPRASGMPHGHGHGHDHSKECNSQVSGVPTAFPGVSSADSPPLPTASAALSDSAPPAEPSGGPYRRHGGYDAPSGDNSGPGYGGEPGSEGDCSCGMHGGPSGGTGDGHPYKSAENPGTLPTGSASGPANPTESGYTKRRIAKLSRMNALN